LRATAIGLGSRHQSEQACREDRAIRGPAERQKNGAFKKIEDILEASRSCPYLLTILRLSVHRPVARNR
jgi:hypothetical protein